MIYRTLGRTGLSVSALALGTVELGMEYGINTVGHAGKPAEQDAIRLVHAALNGGINLIDTARAYGDSERVLGHALRARREQVVLATKASAHDSSGKVWSSKEFQRQMLKQLETSLQLLQTDYIDIWLIHNVDEALLERKDDVAALFDEVTQNGKVCFVGGSFYGAELPLAGLNAGFFDIYQITYSVLDQRLADHFFDAAHTQNVGVIARSVLLQGALTERGDYLPDHLEPLRERSRHFRQVVAASELDLSAAQAAVAFALAQEAVQSVLVGVNSQAELQENLQALDKELPPDLLDQLYPLRLDDTDLLNPGTWTAK